MHGRQMWTAGSDAEQFFGVVPRALRAAGVGYRRMRPEAFWVPWNGMEGEGVCRDLMCLNDLHMENVG